MEMKVHVTPQNVPFVPAQKGTIYLWSRKLKPAQFDPDDLLTCFATKCQATPKYRLVTVEGDGRTDDGDVIKAGIGFSFILAGRHAFRETR